MLEELRKKNGLSRTFVADKLGIHRDTVKSLEKGETELRVRWLAILSELYHVKEFQLLQEYLNEKREKHEQSKTRNVKGTR